MLATYADRDGDNSRPMQRTVADKTGMSLRTVRRAVAELRKHGWLSARWDLVGTGKRRVYELHHVEPIAPRRSGP